MIESKIKPGQLYKHYKGDTYKIIVLTKHTETEEDLVVYERQTDVHNNGPAKIWARPLTMFLDIVEFEGYNGPRFTYIGE